MAESKSNEETLCKYTLPLCCDSVECCRYAPYQSITAVGHYQLNSETQSKIGGISLFKYDSSNNNDKDNKINQLSFKQTPPILDLKWHSMNNNKDVYITSVASKGLIQIFALNDKSELQLKCEQIIPSIDNDEDKDMSLPICLSLDWNNKNTNLCVTSLSDGSIAVLQFDDDKSKILTRTKIHNDQVWTASFDKFNNSLIYSGADDNLLSIYDYKSNKSIYKNDNIHKMGICSIIDSFKNEYTLLTGSYDEYLRLFDKRKMNQTLDELKFKDGVWRIKWNQKKNDKILIATMRDHFNIVQFDETEQKLEKIYCYTKHEDNYKQMKDKEKEKEKEEDLDILAYGCDWSPDNFIATCSFYDKQFHCWQY